MPLQEGWTLDKLEYRPLHQMVDMHMVLSPAPTPLHERRRRRGSPFAAAPALSPSADGGAECPQLSRTMGNDFTHTLASSVVTPKSAYAVGLLRSNQACPAATRGPPARAVAAWLQRPAAETCEAARSHPSNAWHAPSCIASGRAWRHTLLRGV